MRLATRKVYRRRLARSELLVHLASTAQRWADEVADRAPGAKPFAEWPDDEPRRRICATYDLTPTDLDRLLTELAEGLERRALRAGYEEAWV